MPKKKKKLVEIASDSSSDHGGKDVASSPGSNSENFIVDQILKLFHKNEVDKSSDNFLDKKLHMK